MAIKLKSLVPFPPLAVMIGELTEPASADSSGRVLVQWRLPNGSVQEKWLAIVRGLTVRKSDRVLIQRPANGAEWIVTHALGAPEPRDIHVQRKRITLEAQDEIVLRSGQASITLRRNGRLVIRGVYVESRSKGTNRIKGGSVLIN